MVPHYWRTPLNRVLSQPAYAVPALSSRHMSRLMRKLARFILLTCSQKKKIPCEQFNYSLLTHCYL
ncbi:hypothetical protein FQ626_04390 [Erwinia pyrifoliae]|nr:hypothetical protein [Erwinia pyrifoliae]